MRPFFRVLLFTGFTAGPLAAQAQQPIPTPTPAPVMALSEDSVRIMSALVQTSVRKLRDIYFEPSDTHAVQLIETALQEIPALNQRLSRYTASLPREQQQALAQRLRQQPWQIELQTLMRSPQFRNFDARVAKNPDLKAATERLRASGFAGTARVPAASTSAASTAPTGTISLPAAKPQPSTAPALVPKPATPGKVAVLPTTPTPKVTASKAVVPATKPVTAAASQHTVQKGETLFSISRQYGVTPSQLQAWNKKADGGVKIGESILVVAPK
ncbi:LysM peptidoglycan-binding domain-containing protein [Hymenobacter elongatus]|uniref:LysM peptidoglycan-binding domain-containing protein n=1 Tax=Hymenobacter elongatus TaxID=877208 RepID=A0A4Z0PPQ9_9BACT|nr:LysM peptidoglycan-binding domain-containing protein [Hymenobacter elongatus]TGE19352.1 LysM peptidoglycan-binding domain-containing protein [Hymenobacter elongatus]